VFDTRTGRPIGTVAPGTQHLPVFVGRRWLVHLQRHIITAYELSDTPSAVLNRLPAADLIDIIVAAVIAESR